MRDLAVLARTDSFSDLWPTLARELEIGYRLLPRGAEEVTGGTEAVAWIVSVAGAEQEAEALVRDLRARGVVDPLVVGAAADHRLAAALVRSGAADYFALPGDLEPLRSHLAELVRRVRSREARAQLAAGERSAFDFSRIIGRSPQLRVALDRAARVIPHASATVLITGDTGTGKELLAQAIHYNGPRAATAFVELNCAAIPPTLLESELFGHERGAFTDARTAKPGLFEAAHGGTLFLDEIGHLPYELQGKILKALEEKRVRRLGAVVAREVDVRIIAATHVELGAAVGRGEFREDLFYRLNVIPIHLPVLRERGDDVLLLAEHFLRSLGAQYDLAPPQLTPEMRAALLAHHWPGNVRELRNALERALLLGDGVLSIDDLSPHARAAPHPPAGSLPFPAPLAAIERAAARSMLERMEGNKSAAADALEISRSRLYRLLDPESAPAPDV